MNLRKGTQQHVVYELLLPHNFTRTDKLIEKSGLPKASLSSTLTVLRRKGLAEYTGEIRGEGGLRWKRHPIAKPMFPPQKDVAPRKHPTKPQVESYTDIADRITEDLRKLRWLLGQQQKQLDMYEEFKKKLLGDA